MKKAVSFPSLLKKIGKILLRYLPVTVLAVLLGLGIRGGIAARLAGNSVPMTFGIGFSSVLSGSMEGEAPDSLSVGDLIVIRRQDSYSAGDVVVWQSVGSATVHRIVSLDGDTVITKGDANNTEDEPISLSDIRGKVVASVPKLGGMVLLMRNPLFLVLLFAVSVLLLNLRFRREKAPEDEERKRIRAEIKKLKKELEHSDSDS